MLFTDSVALLRRRLAGPLPGIDAHLALAPRPRPAAWQPGVIPADARAAAALLLLYPIDDRAHFVLTVRTDDLPHHGGQVCLPGGGIATSETAERAALRETREELGVAADAFQLLGALTPIHVVVSRFALYPFVAAAAERPLFDPAPREVAKVLEVPLTVLGDLARFGRERKVRDGIEIDVPYLDVSGHHVWGATAMILAELMYLLGWQRT